jgi:uncharacterized protein (TIGR03437 family)
VKRTAVLLCLGAAALFARSAGSPPGHAGVPSTNPVDNTPQPAQTCARCHVAGASLAGGFARIEAFHYRPGQRQTIRVTVSHPDAARWGFQLTARRAGSLHERVGTFSASSEVRVFCSDNPAGRDVTPDNPCGPQDLEFATHTAPSTTTGGGGTKTWEVEWTAPETDLNDVVFFAAGNAANASGNNQGDRVYTASFTIEPDPGARNCPSSLRPTLNSVQNAASFTRDVSINTLITIRGLDFTPSGTRRAAGTADFREGYPKELACVAVEIGGVRAPLLYVSPDQINAQVPTLRASGDVPVRVIVNPGRQNQIISDAGSIRLVDYSPALFTFDGRSVAAINNATGGYVAMPSVVQGGSPARPGDIVQLYATGLGLSDPVWQAGEMPTRVTSLSSRITVTIGGTAVPASDILYAGVVPGMISGLYQINVRIPASVADGNVPVTVSVGGATSAAGTTLPIQR